MRYFNFQLNLLVRESAVKYSHFSFRCIGRTRDGELGQRAAVAFGFVDGEHLKIERADGQKK